MPDELERQTATVSRLPLFSSDGGNNHGGSWILSIGQYALVIGEAPGAQDLANEIAARWNMQIGERRRLDQDF